nr:SAM-dependent methyltransferase [Rhizobium sp. Khangiran2]
MPPAQLSSGDAIADRRMDYARMLFDGGDLQAALELVEQAVELVPAWAAGWFRLGEYREKASLVEHAVEAFRKVLAIEPQDIFGARLKLALLGAEEVPEHPPSRYVESLFDGYADRFETALVEKLGYSVPARLAEMLVTAAPYRLAVDLGCGTGLMGLEARPRTRRLEGFDLSLNMIEKARQKHIYDHLAQADFSLPADRTTLFSDVLARHRADLVMAADVLIYLGSLQTVFPLVTELLAAGGLFAFSIEDAGVDEGFVLRDSLRYAHSEDYIRQLLDLHHLRLLEIQRIDLRHDRGKPVGGMLFLSQKQ